VGNWSGTVPGRDEPQVQDDDRPLPSSSPRNSRGQSRPGSRRHSQDHPSVSMPLAFFDDDRPQFHVQPPAGWMNDPNGPIYYKGRFHMFYQYLPEKCEWDFGIVWGHAYSEDLVHWDHLPPALVPSPGWVDADGCFSGCCVLDDCGKPMILYTGVRLRSNHEVGPLPPCDQDLGMVFIESQCAAVPADEDDELLVRWTKLQMPFLKLPPRHETYFLTGWRDPFIFNDEREGYSGVVPRRDFKYKMLMGSGLKDKGGTALVYGSESLEKGWELLGLLCEGNHSRDDTGIVWECPLIVRLSKLPSRLGGPSASRRPPEWLWRQEARDTSAQRLSSADIVRESGLFKVDSSVEDQASGLRTRRSKLSREASSAGVNRVLPGFTVQTEGHDSVSRNDVLQNGVIGREAAKIGVTKNPSISLLAQKLERVAIGDNQGQASFEKDGSSSEAPSIASRVNSINVDDALDSFDVLKSKVKPLNVVKTVKEDEREDPGNFSLRQSDHVHLVDRDREVTNWHLFTVSPDAPTNPVLYWIGKMIAHDDPCPKFDIDNAKGPFKLDLGDILYAPNVCQDGFGRWLLWGWLQERRKVGSYAYSGCLTLPRVLHVTNEGRLIQCPVEEIDNLRSKGRQFNAKRIALAPNSTYPIKRVRSERLDIQCSIERGTSSAAGLLFRSHEAEAEGSTAIIYDWSTNQLEAIFNVPSNWKPHVEDDKAIPGAFHDKHRVSEDSERSCDPAAMLSRTPRHTGFSLDHSFDGLTEHMAGSPFSLSEPESPLSCSDGELPGSSPTCIAPTSEVARSLIRSGSSMALAMHRSTSVTNLSSSHLGTSYLGTSHLGGASLARGLSISGDKDGAMGSMVGSLTNFMQSTPSMLNLADMDEGEGIEDEDLGTLLEDLAAPMRHEEETPNAPGHSDLRRVGGPLAMQPNQVLHLRIFVDHSSIEVFTGTGECLSTRIYRGRGPNPNNPGIEFISFGGQATIDSCECYEMVSCWKNKVQTPVMRRSFNGSRVESLRTSLDKEETGERKGPISLSSSFVCRNPSLSVDGFMDPESFCVDSDVISPPIMS
jgi:sucrose-6-phosphate hydrolase SacC (GH32 family)